MDTVTELYKECFTAQLADWCHAHGVEYIGHIIEDMNCHMRSGVGHYFRALAPQDMSGMDIVLHQVMPGMDDYIHTVTCATGVGAGSFYHYILAKLCASLAHLTPHMKGRAMCEVFGAYGYGEDSPMMKYLMDHLLVRGINRFVPHAFDSKFPDTDCPPHFGAEGHDPSFEAFSALMGYVNKVAHLLDGTVHKASAAILYHVDGEWASRFDNAENMEPYATALYDAHIDYDIVWLDVLRDSARVEDGRLKIADESFNCLIVPYADHIPEVLAEVLKDLIGQGLAVWFGKAMPDNVDFDAEVVYASDIPEKMRALGMTDIEVEGDFPKLRIYHSVRDGKDVLMLANEDYARECDTALKLPFDGEYARLDVMTELYASGKTENGRLRVRLKPGQSEVILFGENGGFEPEITLTEGERLEPSFTLELADCDDLSAFESKGEFESFFNVNRPDFLPEFSGKMRYTFTVNVSPRGRRAFLDLGRVGQNAVLTVNGKDCGIRIAKPYLFEVTGAIEEGENEITVTVSNTLGQRMRDGFTSYLQLSPSGLLGGMRMMYAKDNA
jgi:hypothetical protein